MDQLRLRLAALSCALTLTLACAQSAQGPDEDTEISELSHELSTSQSREAVYVLESGHYGRYVYHGATSESFWVDLSVRNDAYQKDVGVVWTNDGWRTTHTTKASYETTLSGGRERWGVEVKDFAGTWGGQSVEVEYAAYVRMNGSTFWSPYRNHYIYNSVSPASPLRLLESHVEIDASGQPVLRGTARALNVTGSRRVFVRYSTDGFASHGEVEASFDGKDFAFQTQLPYASSSTERVLFAVRLEAQGETHWINNGGANYTHRLAPEISSVAFQDDGSVPSAGIRVLSANAASGLPITEAWITIDDTDRRALPEATGYLWDGRGGFSPWGGIRFAFPVADLSMGSHSLELEVRSGPFKTVSAPLSFVVSHDIGFVSSWDLSPGETAWDLEVRPDGRVFVMRETRIDVFSSYGEGAPQLVLSSPQAGRLSDMSVADDGRVFALQSWSGMIRFAADGSFDTSFGDMGVLSLGGTYAGRTVCYAANVEVVETFLYVVDSCNSRVLRFDLDGAFLGELDLNVDGVSTNVTRVFDDGQKLWVGQDLYADGVLAHQLVAISNDPELPPSVMALIELDPRVTNLDAFAIEGESVWATSGWTQLQRLHAQTGVREAVWTGGGRVGLDGALSIGRALSVLADGSVAVLSVDTNRVERFSTLQ